MKNIYRYFSLLRSERRYWLHRGQHGDAHKELLSSVYKDPKWGPGSSCGRNPFILTQWTLKQISSALLLTHTCLCVFRLQAEEEAVVKLCLHSLSLRSLSKEPSVSSSQMILCCKKLVEQRCPLMQGLHICVSHFYSVMQDGDLCIPWDWKSWTGGTRPVTVLEISIFSS